MADAGTPAGKPGQEEALKKVSNQISGAAADIAVVGKTIRSCPEATKTTRSAIQTVQSVSQQFFYTLAILLVLFIVHQIFIWVDNDPEKAFDRGALVFEVAEITWDTTGILYNAGVDIVNAGIIPFWNSAAFYVFEPTIVLIIEIFSLIFTRQHWQGVFSEDDFPYFGLDCTASPKSAQWCGELSPLSPQSRRTQHARHPPFLPMQVGTSTTRSNWNRRRRRRILSTSRPPTPVGDYSIRTTNNTRLEFRRRGD